MVPPPIPALFIASRSAVIPGFETLPFTQCHQTCGFAEAGGWTKEIDRGSAGCCACAGAGVSPLIVRKSEAPAQICARFALGRNDPDRNIFFIVITLGYVLAGWSCTKQA